MSSSLAPEDILLRQAARGQSDLFSTLVEQTFPRAWVVMKGSRGGLLFVYRSMRDHLDEVDSRTRFWDWFTQIAVIPRKSLTSAPSASDFPPEALRELLESLESTPVSRSQGLLTRLTRLYLSGWLTAFGTSIMLTLLIIFRGGVPSFDPGTAVALVPTTAIFAATMSSLLLGPWLSHRYPVLNYLALFPVSVLTSLFAYSSLELFANGSSLEFGLEFERVAIDSLRLATFRDLTPTAIGTVVVTFIGIFLTRLRSWVINRSRTSWRRFLSILIACSLFGWVGYRLGPTLIEGWDLDSDILAAVSSSPRIRSQAEILVPRAYSENPVIRRLTTDVQKGEYIAPTFEELESARAIWLSFVRKGWPAPGMSARTSELKALTQRPELFFLAEPIQAWSAQQVEVAIRASLISPYAGTENILHPAKTSGINWKNLADLAASTRWLPTADPVDESRVWAELHGDVQALEEPESPSPQSRSLGEPLFLWYQRLEQRAQINQIAEEIRQLLPELSKSGRVWSLKLANEIRGVAAYSNVFSEVSQDQAGCRKAAELALRLELKNLQANGKPQPKRPSDLRPPFNEIAETYADWFTLEKLWAELSPAK